MDKQEVIARLEALFAKRTEFYSFFDTKIPKLDQSDLFDFKKLNDPNLEEFYKLFHHYDYAIRKLLPSVYSAYEIDTEKDLKKDF